MRQPFLIATYLLSFILLFVPGSRAGTAQTPSAAAGWLAFGDIRGHLEPCGCDPATDLGGIKRLAIALQRERALHAEALVFDLGNDVPLPEEPELKTPFLLTASARMRPQATLLNHLELARVGELKALSTAAKAAEKAPGEAKGLPPYILSNAKPGSAAAQLAKPWRSGPGWVALGFTDPAKVTSGRSDLLPLDGPLLKQWQSWLAAHPAGEKFLLFSGSDAELKTILAAKLFTTVISSNTRALSDLPGVEEKQDEARLLRLGQTQLPMVPLGGQGLLRGGALQFDEAKPLAQLLDERPPTTGTGTGFGQATAWLKKPTLVSWLGPDLEAAGAGPLQSLYDDYNKATKAAFSKRSDLRLAELKTTPFAGWQACASCHPEAVKIYQSSQHAHAMATLVAKGKQEDGECVACHVVGAAVPGGFVSIAASPQLANVQCENCHGPSLAHSRDPSKSPKLAAAAKAMCVTCHNKQHSPAFDFATYWPRIKH